MAVFIKNTTGSNKVYDGQTIAPGAFYEIQHNELSAWQNDSVLLTDIGNGDAVVAKDDTGNTNISDVAGGINWLRGIGPTDEIGNPRFAPTFEDDLGLSGTWKGNLYTATAGALNIYDEPVTTELKLRGGWYELMAPAGTPEAVEGDYLEFSVVDKTNVTGVHTLLGATPFKYEIQTV